ncbi:T9SS type A sorting domain-containing protein [Flavobacteriaceae bacterium]|nr:T9SS type A sorting domain-containing protein [Flavobacteriaceae bacterium]
MKKLIVVSFVIVLFTNFSFAQCPTDEVEIRVDILTDNYGYENYWILSYESGDVIIQGGQGGVYENFTNYSETACVPEATSVIFEIFDEYGDGIFAPGGYWLYVDNLLVSNGSDDIGSYATFTTNTPCETSEALIDLQNHINSNNTLTETELLAIRDVFLAQPQCLPNEEFIVLAKSVIEEYDSLVGPLFSTANTVNGFSKDPVAAPGLGMERAMVALQQAILDFVMTPEVYAEYPEHIDGWIFNTSHTFPGYVDPPADPSVSHSMLIRANFKDPAGTNPHLNINGDQTNHALRPTGLYLAPGSIATITVPNSLVGQGYYIRVGSHEWDLGIRPKFYRLDRITKKFPIDASTIEVFNPFGGAISILVPYESDSGIVEISITNGVESPFFSLKSFYETPNFNTELNKSGPWAVFETDNVMFTIPSHSIVPGQYDLMQTLIDWDTALQGVNSIMAREIVSDKHNMYMIADITIRHNVYSIGYPMSNTPLSFTDVPGPAYFMNGPGPDDETNFHESGHALAMTKFPGEVEAIVNFPYIMAMNYGLNEDLNEAVKHSFVPNTFDIDKTATHRMVSNTFGSERDISNTTTDEVRYQHRGYGHYFEIVNILDWCPLRNFWKQEFIDFENGIDHGINNQDIDSRILRMSAGSQVDLRPLFHVFGILPEDSISLQEDLDQLDIIPSEAIYNRLQDYFTLIPEDNAAFVDYALNVYPNLYTDGPTATPDYGVGWHYQKSLTYDTIEAQERIETLQGIIEVYYPNGEPSSETADVCCLLDTMIIDLVDEEVIVIGGVAPYEITIDINGNIQVVTVIDFDGCETTAEFPILGLSDKLMDGIKIYPNPASTDIHIDLIDSSLQIKTLQMISLNGQLINEYQKSDRILDITSITTGVYILNIELTDGSQMNKRIIILR